MGIFDFFRRKPDAASRPQAAGTEFYIGDLRDPRIIELLRSGGLMTNSGASITAESSLRVATGYRCVSLITSAIKTLPMDLRRRLDDRTRVDADDHPLWGILRKKPNRWQTPGQFKGFLQTSVLLRGNGYALIVRSRGRITELVPLMPDRVETEQNEDLSLRYTYTRKDGRRVEIPQKDMFHLCGMSNDGVVGQSVISYAREALGLSIQTEKHAAKLFKNGTVIGDVLIHPGSFKNDAAVARIKASLDNYRGADGEDAHKTLILEEGMKYEKLGMTSNDAQLLQTMEHTQFEICMFFGVPPHMVGLTSKTTSWGSGIEQQSIGFVAYTLQDWMNLWQETIERDLLTDDDPKLYVKINPAGLIRGDIKTRYNAYSIGKQWGWLSTNDIREKEDMDPVEDGDQYIMPMNFQPIGSEGGPPLGDDDDDDDDDRGNNRRAEK